MKWRKHLMLLLYSFRLWTFMFSILTITSDFAVLIWLHSFWWKTLKWSPKLVNSFGWISSQNSHFKRENGQEPCGLIENIGNRILATRTSPTGIKFNQNDQYKRKIQHHITRICGCKSHAQPEFYLLGLRNYNS